MKYPRLLFILLALLVGCDSHILTSADNTPPTLGVVQAAIVTGDVKLIARDGSAQPLARGNTFSEGTLIKVGSNSTALLVFSNGATMKLSENTLLNIDLFRQAVFDAKKEGTFLRLTRDPSLSVVDIDIRQGHIQGEIKGLNVAAGSSFTIQRPHDSMLKAQGIFDVTASTTSTDPRRG